MKKEIKLQAYDSTHDFISTNKLEKEAEEVFGKDWEAEFDTDQIRTLIHHVGRHDLKVTFLEGLSQNDILVDSWFGNTFDYVILTNTNKWLSHGKNATEEDLQEDIAQLELEEGETLTIFKSPILIKI